MTEDASGRYSLAGIRQATTEPHEAFIAKAQAVLAGDDRVLAAYLVSGFAVGRAMPSATSTFTS